MNKETNIVIEKKEQVLQEQIKLLNNRCDDLQQQIREIEEDRKRVDVKHLEKAGESLLDREHFNYEEETSSTEDESAAEDDCNRVPTLPKFEAKNNRYKHNLKEDRFKEPRMFTMEQLRNITFALINQSTLNERVRVSEKKIVKVNATTIELDEMDKQLKFAAQKTEEEISERITKFKEDHQIVQRQNEKTM